MAWTYGFFNSVNGDRTYNSQQMSEMFDGLITEGVYESVNDRLLVSPNNGMVIQIGTGRGFVGGHWVKNDSEYLMTLEDSDVLLNRYCAVCIRSDKNNSVREAVPYLKYSEFASEPVKPTMERTENVTERCLAYVYIKAGASEITALDIEDTRSNTELCGWVTGLIKQVDTTDLYNQYKADWEKFKAANEGDYLEWIENLESYVDEDLEVKLASDVLQLKGRELKTTVLLSGSAWVLSNGKYTQTVSVNGVSADSDLIVSPKNEELCIESGCKAVSCDYHSITFECDKALSVDLVLEVLIFNVDTLADVTMESINTFAVTDDGAGNVTITN